MPRKSTQSKICFQDDSKIYPIKSESTYQNPNQIIILHNTCELLNHTSICKEIANTPEFIHLLASMYLRTTCRKHARIVPSEQHTFQHCKEYVVSKYILQCPTLVFILYISVGRVSKRSPKFTQHVHLFRSQSSNGYLECTSQLQSTMPYMCHTCPTPFYTRFSDSEVHTYFKSVFPS